MVTAKGTRLHQKAATDLQHDRKLITAKFLGFGFPLNQGQQYQHAKGRLAVLQHAKLGSWESSLQQ